jgi:hypothetical protein
MLVILLPYLLACRAAFSSDISMGNGTTIQSPSVPYMTCVTGITSHCLSSFSSSLWSPCYCGPRRQPNWHHCICRVIWGDTNFLWSLSLCRSKMLVVLVLFSRSIIIPILGTAPKPMSLTPCGTLTFLPTILRLSTTSALGPHSTNKGRSANQIVE